MVIVHDDIKTRYKFSFCVAAFSEIGQHQVATIDGYAIEQKIIGISGFILDIELSYEWWFALRKYCNVNVWRSAGIGHRADGAKAVAPVRVGDGMAVTLEVCVQRLAAMLARMAVTAIRVALPDFNSEVGERTAVEIDDAATEVRNQSRGAAVPARDRGQIVVVVERQLDRVERPGCLARCRNPIGCDDSCAGCSERGYAEQQLSSRQVLVHAPGDSEVNVKCIF